MATSPPAEQLPTTAKGGIVTSLDQPPRPALGHLLPWVGLAVCPLAALPPYMVDLNTDMRVEMVDHVVPSALVVVVSVVMLVRFRRTVSDLQAFPVVAGFLILLAGLWMTATHLPLVNQARMDENDVSSLDAAWHTVPGLVVLILGLVWTAMWWSARTAEPRAMGAPDE